MSTTEVGESSSAGTPRTLNAEETAAARFVSVPDLGPIQDLVIFSIRNGTVEEARSLLVRPTVPAGWHWRHITNLPARESIRYIGVYIQMYLAQLIHAQIANATAEQVRKMGIALGVSRAVMTALYDITPQDLIVGESAVAWVEMVTNAAGMTQFATTAAAPEDVVTAMGTDLVLTADEVAAVAALHMSSIGILPLQGYSLTMCGHHYLSDPATQSRKAYEVVEKTHWAGAIVSAWFSQDAEKVRDALWHKAGHPVNLTIKRRLAFDPRITKILAEAGAGAAASRLPAQEPELRAANSYRTLCQTVTPLLESYGGKMSYEALDVAYNTVLKYPAENPTLVINTPNLPNVPETVRNRATALQWLQYIMDKNKDFVAMAYGFYSALSEQNAMLSGGSSSDSLKTSFSLTKLKTQSFASFVTGQQYYGDFTAYRASQKAAGVFSAPTMAMKY